MTKIPSVEEQKKYWYRFSIQICPVCGQEYQHEKERVFTPKPKDWNERHEITQIYDYCNS